MTAWLGCVPAQQGKTSKPKLVSLQTKIELFLQHLPSSMLPLASCYSLGRGLGLSLPFWVFVKASCEFCLLWTVGGRPGRHTDQLKVSSQMKGLRTKKIQGSRPALLDHEIGIPQQRGEKLGRRTEYIAARQLSTRPPPFSKLLSSFYVITFR